ncbi:hypothetical protein [Sphingobacterium arenae]|nr:hypothetical protein [Sphingobacterium arenae]
MKYHGGVIRLGRGQTPQAAVQVGAVLYDNVDDLTFDLQFASNQ